MLLCFFKSKTGKLAEVPAVLIRVSALSLWCAMQCGQPSMKPLSLAIARGRAGLKDTNKWKRGIAPDCWTDYHCFKRFKDYFLRATSLCELGCWLPYNHSAVHLWVFPVLEAVMFFTATIWLQTSPWGTTIALGWLLGFASHHVCHPQAFWSSPLLATLPPPSSPAPRR